jgi:hypothetical protein
MIKTPFIVLQNIVGSGVNTIKQGNNKPKKKIVGC